MTKSRKWIVEKDFKIKSKNEISDSKRGRVVMAKIMRTSVYRQTLWKIIRIIDVLILHLMVVMDN